MWTFLGDDCRSRGESEDGSEAGGGDRKKRQRQRWGSGIGGSEIVYSGCLLGFSIVGFLTGFTCRLMSTGYLGFSHVFVRLGIHLELRMSKKSVTADFIRIRPQNYR